MSSSSSDGSIVYTHPTPGRLTTLCVSVGSNVEEGAVVAEFDGKSDHSYITVTASHEGKVEEIVAKQGQEYSRGDVLLRIVACSHDIQFGGLCASCGKDLTMVSAQASSKHSDITIVHGQPRLTVTRKQAEHIEKETAERLLKQKKLSLVLDLDHTLIHAATGPHFVQFANFHKIDIKAEKLHEFVLPGSTMKYFVKLRPYLKEFLAEAAKIFELHMYTFGTHSYALKIADIIDPTHHNFKDRILSRDTAGDIDYKTLKKIFPCDDSMVLIVDDREDVWKRAQNLVKIEPFLYFVGAAEINPHPWDHRNPPPAQPNGQPLPQPPQPQPKPAPTVHHLKPPSRRNSNNHQQTHKPRPTEKENGEKAENGAKKETVQKESEKITENTKNTEGATDGKHLTNGTSEPSNGTVENKESEKKAENGHTSTENEGSEKADKDKGDKEKESGETVARAQEDTSSTDKPQNQDKIEEMSKIEANEQKKPDAPRPPPDECLPLMLDILREIHARYYDLHAKGKPSDVKVIATEMRRSVLEKCNVVFSGFYPREVDPRITSWGKLALSFGAEVQTDLTETTTHLIAKKNHTDKVKLAHAKHIPVVTENWLVVMARSWKKPNEGDHLLPPDDGTPIPDVKAENGAAAEQKKSIEANAGKPKHTDKHTNGHQNGKSVVKESNGHPKPAKIAKQEPPKAKEQDKFADLPYAKAAKWDMSHTQKNIFSDMKNEAEDLFDEDGDGEGEGDEEGDGEFDYDEDRDEEDRDASMEDMEDDSEEPAYKPSKGMANLLKQRSKKRKVAEVEEVEEEVDDDAFASMLEDQIGNQ